MTQLELFHKIETIVLYRNDKKFIKAFNDLEEAREELRCWNGNAYLHYTEIEYYRES